MFAVFDMLLIFNLLYGFLVNLITTILIKVIMMDTTALANFMHTGHKVKDSFNV